MDQKCYFHFAAGERNPDQKTYLRDLIFNGMIDSKLINTAIEASLKAGMKILEVYKSDDFDVDFKSDDSPLTKADKLAHGSIMQYLNGTEYPILSEEGVMPEYELRKTWPVYWCVDPLDGTKEFIKKNGEFTVNIALIEGQVPVLGIIYVPVLELLYLGVKDVGAFKLNHVKCDRVDLDFEELKQAGEQLPINYYLDKLVIVGSRSHMTQETTELIDKLVDKYGDSEIISKGSSLKLCMVAEGLANIYPRFAPTMEWDTAAGHAIALAAGLEVTRADGKSPLLYNKQNLSGRKVFRYSIQF